MGLRRIIQRLRPPTHEPVPVRRDDLHRLPKTLAPHGVELPPFDPRPLTAADANLRRWLADARVALREAGASVTLAPPDADLLDLLTTARRHVDPHNEALLLRLLGGLTGGVFRGPHTFHLDVANACNVNCSYCWFHSPSSKDRPDAADFDAAWRQEMVPWPTFTALVDDLAALGTTEDVLLSGKGEPLLHPRCLDMVEYITARGLGTTLFSNGVLVREAAREALVEHGCDLLYVSLSSASRAVYEALHPGHSGDELDEVRANVAALSELKRARGRPRPRVMMVDVLCALNAQEALDFYEQARELGAEHVRFQLVHIQDYNSELRLRPEQLEPLRAAIAEAHRRAEAGGPTVVDNIDYQLQTLDIATGKWGHARAPDEGCYVGWTFSRSWTNGDVSFCCSPKVVDSLQERSFAEIWTGEDYAAFRNAARELQANGGLTFRNGAPLLGEHCAGCPNYEGVGKLADDLRRYDLARFVRGAEGERVRGGR